MQLTGLQKTIITVTIIVVSIVFMVMQLSRYALDVSLSSWGSGVDGYTQANLNHSVTGKPVALFFYTDWCENCEALREQVLATEQVTDYFKNLHPVKINPELGSMENKLAESYGVIGYPTFLLVDYSTGRQEQIHEVFNVTPEQFIEHVQQAKLRLSNASS